MAYVSKSFVLGNILTDFLGNLGVLTTQTYFIPPDKFVRSAEKFIDFILMRIFKSWFSDSSAYGLDIL